METDFKPEMSREEMVKIFHQNSELDEETCEDILEQKNWNLIDAFREIGLNCPIDLTSKIYPDEDSFNSLVCGRRNDSSWTISSSKQRKNSKAKEQIFVEFKPDKENLIKRYLKFMPKSDWDTILRRELCFPATHQLILDLGSQDAKQTLVLLRGLPGSGKSTLGDLLISLSETGVKVSADDLFSKGGVYKFNKHLLKEAHNLAQKNCEKAMKIKATPIVVDNTNTEIWEMLPYVKMALRYCYDIKVVEPNTKWKFETNVLVSRNTHGVPKEAIDRMKMRFDHQVTVQSLIEASGVVIETEVELTRLQPSITNERQIRVSDFVPLKSVQTTSLPLNEQSSTFQKLETNSLPYLRSSISNHRRAAVFPTVNDTSEQSQVFGEDYWSDDTTCTSSFLNGISTSEEETVNVYPPISDTAREYLKNLFPKQKLEFLEEYFNNCGRDINYCCDLLLEGGYGDVNEIRTASIKDSNAKKNVDDSQLNNLETLGAVGGDINPQSLPQVLEKNEESKGRTRSGEDVYVPIDGDDWLDLQLDPSFVSQLTETYSNPICGFELSSLSPDYLKIKVPPKMAFKLFQYLSLNVMRKVEASSNAQELEQIESDAKFAAFLAENDISVESCNEPTLVQISNLEVKLRDNQLSKAKEFRDQIPLKFASLLKLHKLKACFPRLPEIIVMQYLEQNMENFDLALNTLKLVFAEHFDPSGLSETFECQSMIKSAVGTQLETLQKMRENSSPEPNEKTGFEWRDLSNKHYMLKQEYQEKVQIASQENHHFEVARHYAVMSATHNELMNVANAKAKEWFLLHFNQGGSANKLDLHCQTAKEAIKILAAFIREKVADLRNTKGQKRVLQIITGRANNSTDGIPRLYPAVQDYLNRRRIRYDATMYGQFFITVTSQTVS